MKSVVADVYIVNRQVSSKLPDGRKITDMDNEKILYKIPNYCPTCNSIVETGVLFSYSYDMTYTDELQNQGTSVVLSKCLNCSKPILFTEDFQNFEDHYIATDKIQLYPNQDNVALKNAPDIVNNPFKEATKCYRAQAYEACAIMCRKGIEAICQDKGQVNGNLAQKLRNLKDNHILEETFYNWANELRGIGNDGAHSHDQKVLQQDAKDALNFFEALITYLYHLVDQYEQLRHRRR